MCAVITWASVRPTVSAASSRRAFSVSMGSLGLGEAGKLLGLVLGGERRGDLREVAVHDVLDLVEGQVDAVVGHASLREVVGADAVGAVPRADQALPLRGLLRRLLAHLLLLDARGEDAP